MVIVDQRDRPYRVVTSVHYNHRAESAFDEDADDQSLTALPARNTDSVAIDTRHRHAHGQPSKRLVNILEVCFN